MKRFFVIYLTVFLFVSCKKPRTVLPLNILVENIDTALKQTEHAWFYKQHLFNGYMVEKGRDGKILYRLPIIDGKEEGEATGWYNTGEKLMLRHFMGGMKEGLFEQWWPNGNLRYLFNYKNDVFEGRQMIFYPSGNKRQESNYLNGKEEGLQRSWKPDGVLISNYTIKNNKLYGIIRVKNCMPHGH